MDQMTQSATAVVRARVTGSSASFTGSLIYTHYNLQVSETLKGTPAREVLLPGGIAGGYRQSFPGVPQLHVESEYVIFLWTSPSTGLTQVVGFSQGIFNVSTASDGSVQVSRPQIGETMLDAAGHRVLDHAIRIMLTDLRSVVGKRANQ
jgi:hypothetical protein